MLATPIKARKIPLGPRPAGPKAFFLKPPPPPPDDAPDDYVGPKSGGLDIFRVIFSFVGMNILIGGFVIFLIMFVL